MPTDVRIAVALEKIAAACLGLFMLAVGVITVYVIRALSVY